MFHTLLQIKFLCGTNDSDYQGGFLNNNNKGEKILNVRVLNKDS